LRSRPRHNGPQLDLDKAGLDAAVQKFGTALQGADVGLFYYAGHGVQVRGSNFLVPISGNLTREADVDFEMLDANIVLRQMEAAGTKLNLIVLDACRNNPFVGRGLRAAEGGLAQMKAPEGSLISFATQPGNVALDGEGNSPYAKALAVSLRKAGLDIFQTFNDVGLTVKRATGGAQQPWVSSSPIEGHFYFVAPPPSPPAPDQSAQAWAAVHDTTSIAVLDTYIRQFGDTAYGSFARARRDELARAADQPATSSTAAPAASPPAAPSATPPKHIATAAQAQAPSPWPATHPAALTRHLARPEVEKLFVPFDQALKLVETYYVEYRDEADLYGAADAAMRRAFPPPREVAGQVDPALAAIPQANRNQFFASAMSVLNARGTADEDNKIVEVAIRGLVASLDAHSTYLDANNYRAEVAELNGSFFRPVMGLLVLSDGMVRVDKVYEGTSAARAGIAINDAITMIDGVPLQGMGQPDILARLRGAIGSKVHLQLKRPGRDSPLELDIVRESIQPPVVATHLEGADVGYVRILGFAGPKARDTVRQAFALLAQAAGKERLKGFILDLRNSSSSLFLNAVAVADDLLTHGDIVSIRGRKESADQRFSATEKEPDVALGKPIVVLINGGTRGGGEIVAGALHDNLRATLIGTRTFGYGTTQGLFPLSDDRGAVRITTIRKFTPAGNDIQAKGIAPDKEVLQDEPPGTTGRPIGEATLAGHLPGQSAELSASQWYVPPDVRDDKALAAALAELRGGR
jgi:C-terminal peptidase prc